MKKINLDNFKLNKLNIDKKSFNKKMIVHGVITVSGIIASGSLLLDSITAVPVIGVIGVANYLIYKIDKKYKKNNNSSKL